MNPHLHGRSFLKELDFTTEEWHALLGLAQHLKLQWHTGPRRQQLAEKNIAVIFEKTSTRTRCAFEVAAHHQGAHVTYLDPSGSHLGTRSRARTPHGSWAACTTRSSTAVSRRSRRSCSRRTPASPSG